MIWAELGVGVGVALMAFGAGVLAGIIIAEWRLAALPKAAPPQAEEKGLALLRFWLSPEQAEQYSSYRYFEVIGSDTGSRYRIRHGRMMNIDQLDSAGNKVCAWCFLPVGNCFRRLLAGAEDRVGDVRAQGLGDRKPRTAVYDLTGRRPRRT
jgi:hypothetical protein